MVGPSVSSRARSTMIETGGRMQVDLLEGMSAHRAARSKRQPARLAARGQELEMATRSSLGPPQFPSTRPAEQL